MDFYTQQNKARRFTAVLLFYFIIAVALIMLLVNVVVYYFFIFLEFYPYTPEDWLSQGVVYYISFGTLALILSGSLYRWYKLKSGGSAVASMMGAEPLKLNTSDLKERQLINVIEEMSIASGVPLPDLYVMRHEPGINAFVAGYQPTEAVMVVTQGAIDQLSREEMQGVAAHEFSHILNGDMRINIKLISIIAGIVMISVAGRIMMRGSSRSGSGRGGGAIVLLGLALLLLGYLGVFFGRLIKAAVSRQREYLADAAAVQFTRNPKGIASALNTIRLSSHQSRLRHEHAEDMSHMCFSWALPQKFTSWMATHPPLLDRIKRVDPSYVGLIKAKEIAESPQYQATTSGETGIPVQGFSHPAHVSAADVAEAPGQITQAHYAYAEMIHHSLGESLLASIHSAVQAPLVAFALVLVKMDDESAIRSFEKQLDKAHVTELQTIIGEIVRLGDDARIPIVDLLVPVLKSLTDAERKAFLKRLAECIRLDKRYTFHEFVLYTLFEKHLLLASGRDVRVKYHSYKQVSDEIRLLLSLMVHASADTSNDSQQVFDSAIRGFAVNSTELLPVKQIKVSDIRRALTKLSQLSPMLKKNIIQACADIALTDNTLKVMETELIRVIAEYLDCPVPPLVTT